MRVKIKSPISKELHEAEVVGRDRNNGLVSVKIIKPAAGTHWKAGMQYIVSTKSIVNWEEL